MPARTGNRLLVAGLLLVLIGALGLTAVSVAFAPSFSNPSGGSTVATATLPPTASGPFSSAGQRIYYTGVGHDGPIRVNWSPAGRYGGMMRGQGGGPAGIGCVACHGEDGRGGQIGMMFAVRSADIRYETLTASHADDETSATVPGWTDADIARAIRDGVEPDGEPLGSLMPRWSMDDTDMAEILAYLRELK